MNEQPVNLKVSKELAGEIKIRAEELGMTISTYTDRLLRMALNMYPDDPVREFKELNKYKKSSTQEESN